jgi:uncharacterized protein YbjT (DUF2867 family)
MSPFLVTGATGHVGRHVVSELVAAGAGVRALSRHPDRAGLPAGVEVVPGDLAVPDSLEGALDGVGAVFLLWPFFDAGSAPAVLDVIAKHARRVVYLSAMSATTFHADVERAVERSGLEWTFLRPGGFATNTLGWAPQIRAEGVVRWPYGAAARSLIHERDIAAVAVRTLTGDGHAGQAYTLTGPAAVTQADQVRAIGEAIGRPVRWEDIPPAAARTQLLAEGWTAEFADGALGYWASLVTEPEPVTSTVEDLTGRPARTSREWAADHAGDFG